jgi:hypothetical protein
MTLAQRITARADAYVRKPSLAPLPASGEADARREAEHVAWLRTTGIVRGGYREGIPMSILRLAAARELSTTDPED